MVVGILGVIIFHDVVLGICCEFCEHVYSKKVTEVFPKPANTFGSAVFKRHGRTQGKWLWILKFDSRFHVELVLVYSDM